MTAVRSVDLAVEYGELVAIVGPSGSGKSTMLHQIGTLDRPTQGSVRIDGHDVATLSDRQLSALRRAGSASCSSSSIWRRVGRRSPTWPTGCCTPAYGKEREWRAEAALVGSASVNTSDIGPTSSPAGNVNGSRSRAVAGDPAVLLVDEPTGNLDSVSGAGVVELLRELNEAGTTVLVITHDHEIAGGLLRQVPHARRAGDLTCGPRICCASPRTGCSPGRRGRCSLASASRIGIAAMTAVVGISSSSRADLDRDMAALGTNLLTVGWESAASYLGFDGHPTTVYTLSVDALVEAVRAVLAPTANPSSPDEVKVPKPSDALAARSRPCCLAWAPWPCWSAASGWPTRW